MDLDTKRAILMLGLDSANIKQCIKAEEMPDDETLIAFVELTLGQDEFEQVKGHIADCHHCYAQYAEIRQLLSDPELVAAKPIANADPGSAQAGLLSWFRETWLFGGYGLATGLATAAVVVIVLTNLDFSPQRGFANSLASFSGSELNWLASNDQVVKSFNPVFSQNTGPIHNVNVGISQALSLVNLSSPVQLPDDLLACPADTSTLACSVLQAQAEDFGLWLTLTGFLCQVDNENSIQQHLDNLPDLQGSDLVFLTDELNTSSEANLCGSAEILFNTLIDR